jgi:lipopolysaccharide export system protein LptC
MTPSDKERNAIDGSRNVGSRRLASRRVGGLRDQLVKVLKWLLPALSAALLVTIIALPFFSKQEVSFLLSRDSIEKTREVLRMEKPRYRGLDSKGRPFEITADRAIQKSSDDSTVELQRLRADLQTKNGSAQLLADNGAFDLKKEQLRISGNISASRADGYEFRTRDAVVDLPKRVAWGVSGVFGDTPIGSFRAARFRVDLETGSVIFAGGTKLHIVPKRK